MNANPVQFLHDADSGTPFTSDPGGTTYIEQGVDQHSTYFLNGGASNDTVLFGQGTTIWGSGGGTLSGDFSMSDSGVTVDGLQAHNASGNMNAFFTPDSMHNVIGSAHDDNITLGNGAGPYDATGGLGADMLTAGNGGGVNTFHYNNFMDSTATSHDTINNWHDGVDAIDLHGADKAAGVTGTWNGTNFANQAAIDQQAVGTIGEYHANGNTFVVDHLGPGSSHDLVTEIAGNHTLDAAHVHV